MDEATHCIRTGQVERSRIGSSIIAPQRMSPARLSLLFSSFPSLFPHQISCCKRALSASTGLLSNRELPGGMQDGCVALPGTGKKKIQEKPYFGWKRGGCCSSWGLRWVVLLSGPDKPLASAQSSAAGWVGGLAGCGAEGLLLSVIFINHIQDNR